MPLSQGTFIYTPAAPVTSLTASPTDGQQSVLTDSTSSPTFAWLLQWSATASKWFFIGGSPMITITTSGLPSNAAPGSSYVDISGAGSLTAPRAGYYMVRHGATIWQNTSTITTEVTVKNGSNASADADAVYQQNIPGANGETSGFRTVVFSSVASSAVIKQQWKNSTGNASITNCSIELTPVWVT